MADLRGRRAGRRDFRPTLDGTLEPRLLMASSAIRAQTAAGGQAVVITATDGARYFVSVYNGGTIRATAASGGRVNLFADGTDAATFLEVNRIVPAQRNGTAHTYQSQGTAASRLNIASITVSSGIIGDIEGYQTANLSGPIVVAGTTRVDRIALSSILPGGSITTGGDLNTLDVYSDVDLSGGNISIGRDLNWFETYGNVTLSNDATFTVGRFLGLILQPAKGSGNAGQGANITGNLTINPGSAVSIGQGVPGLAGVVVSGNLVGASRISLFGAGLTALPPNFLVLGTLSA